MSQTIQQLDPHQLAALIRQKGRALGFDLVGIASAEPSRHRDYLRRWLDDGQAGTMDWLNKRFQERADPGVYLPGARSVICLAANYHHPLESPPAGHGRVARYALGQDYHELFKPRLHALADWLHRMVPDVKTRCAVDTAPVMEKELAARAGLGWIGKNTCLIHPRQGSWLLLAEVLTTLELPADAPEPDRCGTCRRCIEACPTQAITAPYQLDARKCIAYLTIERKGEFSEAQRAMIGEWLFGCDICQEVCPWNHKAPIALDSAFQPRWPEGSVDPQQVEAWDSSHYRAALKGSAMKRLKLPLWKENARAVKVNLQRNAVKPMQ